MGLVLEPALFGPIGRYVAIARGGVRVNNGARWDKRRKGTHRFAIRDARGVVQVTVPVEKGRPGLRWNQVRVSTHGGWQEPLLTTLASAYGRTPYFEYYVDELAEALPRGEMPTVSELDERLERLVCRWLSLEAPEYVADGGRCDDVPAGEVGRYWQVRQTRELWGLSVLDLVFNTGPEGALVLER